MGVRHANVIFWPALAAIGFALHFIWEYAQCEAFFVHVRGPATIGAMLRATLGDLVLTGIAWLGTAFVAWNMDWALHRWTPRVWLSLFGLALVLSLSVELHAQAMDWWVYTERAPLLPLTPVSVLPVLQLLLLFPLSFGLARGVALHLAVPATLMKGASSWNG
ncbi:MAG: hypothetical protein ACSLE2_11590 [Lysobacterales bacterium]|jgi:hypothetical protein